MSQSENSKRRSYLKIWAPRWSTKDVLIATGKVRATDETFIQFTKTSKTSGWYGKYAVDTSVVLASPTMWNGGCFCYVVPLDKLRKV